MPKRVAQGLTKDKLKLNSDIIDVMNKLLLIFMLIFLPLLHAKELEKVSLQFQWLDQFQFAGYYMAKEKGFYTDAGLDVEFKKFDFKTDTVDDVLNHSTTYGIGRSSLIIDKSKKKKIKLLSAIFQSSPLILLATKNSNILSIKDFINKKIMTTSDAYLSVSLHAMANHGHVDPSQMIEQQHSFNIQDLIDGKTDLMASYISNEPFLLKQKGVEYTVFDPKDYGFNFYSDILFTSEQEIQTYPKRTQKFRIASLKGWEYAFQNIDETVELILKKYNTQNKSKEALLFEAQELKKLAYYKTDELGHIDAHKIQRIYDIYNVMGFVKNKINIDELVFKSDIHRLSTLTQEEKNYLKNKKEISVCVKENWLPFEDYKDGKFIGMSADYLNLYTSKLGLSLKIINAKTQEEVVKLLEKKACDVKPVVASTQKLRIPYKSSTPHISDSIVLATRIEQPFVNNLHSLNETIVLIKGFKMLIKYMKKEYPSLKIKEVEDLNTALEIIAKGKAYGYVGLSLSTSYIIQKDFSTKLKIINDFKKIEKGLGVRDDNPLLLSIFNKTIANTSTKEHRDILNKWVVTTVEKAKDYTSFYQALGFALLLILFFAYKTFLSGRYAKALEKEKEKLLQVQRSSNLGQKIAKIGIWTLDYKTEKLEWSDGIHLIFETDHNTFGASFEAFIQFVHPDDRALLTEVYTRSIKKKTDYHLLHRIITSSGELRYVEEKCQNIFDKDGHIEKSIGTVLDITARRETELALEELNTTLEEKVNTEVEKNRLKDQQLLQQSRLAQMGEMISMIAHQWRQPLSAISATSNNLKIKLELKLFDLETQEGIEEAQEYFLTRLGNIDGYVKNLSTTIDDFRDFYKPNKMSTISTLESVIEKSLKIVSSSLINDNITVVKDFQYNQEIRIYDSELMQVVLNLLKNAQDNFKEKRVNNGVITITTKDKTLAICDNGGGIKEDIIENIFDPYFSTKDEKNGTGIGLYMSKMIVENHHKGTLEVHNTQDGACFTISLQHELS